MDLFTEIFENNQGWVAKKTQTDPQYFEKLAQGQHPDILYIGCSDSRVTAEALMGLEPGQMFVHRNVANLVVTTDNNINAVVQYAVRNLKVKHIIVCGHYGCGGVEAAMNPSDMGQLNGWLQTLRDVYRLHSDELDAISDKQQRFDRLVQLNVQEQCINISKIDHVQRMRAETGGPTIHGWVFNLRTGLLEDLGLDMETVFGEVSPIYYLRPGAKVL